LSNFCPAACGQLSHHGALIVQWQWQFPLPICANRLDCHGVLMSLLSSMNRDESMSKKAENLVFMPT